MGKFLPVLRMTPRIFLTTKISFSPSVEALASGSWNILEIVIDLDPTEQQPWKVHSASVYKINFASMQNLQYNCSPA